MKYEINLNEAIHSLSDALDMSGICQLHHGKRVAYIAAECARALDWEQPLMLDLFQASILHDCGNLRMSPHIPRATWIGEPEHCSNGAALLASTSHLRHLAEIVRHHHTPWRRLLALDLPHQVKLSANLIHLANLIDRASPTCQTGHNLALHKQEAITQDILAAGRDWFSPELVEAFLTVSHSEAFWFMLDRDHASGHISSLQASLQNERIGFPALRELVHLFARIIDAKSPFTKQHSEGVAQLAKFLGRHFGLPEIQCEKLEMAGLLHDIGKLGVPDELLEKSGGLSAQEMSTMKRHSFDSYHLLRRITGLCDVAEWAAQHHEREDGSGYPYRLTSDEISLEAKILAVADVFQALAQERPYRRALVPHEILDILKNQVDSGKLHGPIVAAIEHNLLTCWEVATGRTQASYAQLPNTSSETVYA